MAASVLQAGQAFPAVFVSKLRVSKLGGDSIDLGKPQGNYDWKMVVVYRGMHCPLCTNYLKELEQVLPELNELGIDVVAVSADSAERATNHMTKVNPSFSVGYDLSLEHMQKLGLYISEPRLGMDAQRLFAEPGLFVVNNEGNVQIIDISNVPFARPNLKSMVMGIRFIRNLKEKFPVNGSYV